jgi:hypothetical protein
MDSERRSKEDKCDSGVISGTDTRAVNEQRSCRKRYPVLSMTRRARAVFDEAVTGKVRSFVFFSV